MNRMGSPRAFLPGNITMLVLSLIFCIFLILSVGMYMEELAAEMGYYAYGPYSGPSLPPPLDIFVMVLGVGLGTVFIASIVGIVLGAQVTARYNAGDEKGAISLSTAAKSLFFVSLGLMVVGFVLVGIPLVLYAIAVGMTIAENQSLFN